MVLNKMMKIYNNLRTFVYTAIYGDWYWGWEDYEGKPKLLAMHLYYNGDHYIVHLGKLYFGVTY
jgi:hypothetical protein